jgi:peptidoglycan/LPS O-acetylase OafA/YrhL
LYKDIKYFNGLNALRFFAAYLVVLHHAEQIRLKYHLYNLKHYSLFNNGGVGVTFFFVLSGFLITYLLLKENRTYNDISIRNFYVRRILRIWPLYFMLVGIGTLALPSLISLMHINYVMPYHFTQVFGYYLFFMPFMVNVLFGHHLLEPLWSIGVEELFYLTWAPAFKLFKKYLLEIIIFVITLKILLSSFAVFSVMGKTYNEVIAALQFEAMGIGGLGAYIVFNRKKAISDSILFSKPVQLFFYLFIFSYVLFWKELSALSDVFKILWTTPIVSSVFMMLSFCWLIVNIALNEQSVVKLRSKQLSFLGEISYGIYMYHMLVVFAIVVVGTKVLNMLNPTVSTIVFYIVVTTVTILVSYLSKRFFEEWFLKLKTKYEKPQLRSKAM